MSLAPIVFDSVWKKFRRGERHDSLRDLIPSLAKRAFRRKDGNALEEREFWALKDVSFEVNPGEALGIIGRNGAGKSTALKLLTRILKPTRGQCVLRGRVGALIEVAAGFHPDLTGRENVFLQGAIMGMHRSEIALRFDEIVEFAGVGDFVDTPVKRYSSGMNARLGFSIAAHLNPNVLLVDEVLAVGDMSFQERCIRRMKQFKKQGVAMVFVSHNLTAVAELCDRAVLLADSEVRYAGPSDRAIEIYVTSSMESTGVSAQAAFTSVSLTDLQGREVSTCKPGERLVLRAQISFTEQLRDVTFGFVVHQQASGIYAYGLNSRSVGAPELNPNKGDCAEIVFEFTANLTRGQYLLELHAANAATMSIYATRMPAAFLRVQEDLTPHGVADLAASCHVVEYQSSVCPA